MAKTRSPLLCALAALAAAVIMCAALSWPCAAAFGDAAESGASEDIAVDLSGKSEGYSAVLYDNTNGLPTSEANAIAETAEGFIWIGSYSGLIRYDGNTFERIDSTTGVASVVSLHVDSANRLWVGTNDSGVAVMEQGAFTMFNKAEGLGSSSVRAIAEDADGRIYIATTCGVSVIDKDKSVTSIDDPEIAEAYIRDLREGPDGILYGITQDHDVFTIENGKLKGFFSKEKLDVSDIISILPDPDQPGYVYLGTEQSRIYHGSMSKGLKDAEAIDVSPLGYVKSIEIFNGTMWVCADNGIGFMENGSITKIENLPMDNSIDHIMIDYERNLWFTSSRQGVMKIVPNQFTDVFERYNLESEVVNSTCTLDDLLYIGTDSGLVVLGPDSIVKNIAIEKAATASGDSVEASNLIDLLDGSRIRSIIRDSKDRLWFATYGGKGLICYDGGAITVYSMEDGLPSDRVRTVCERKDGSIVAACTGGLAIIENGRVSKVVDESAGLENTEVLTVVEAQNGDIVMGTDGGGIYVMHGSEISHYGTEAGLRSDVVMRIKPDRERDLLWIVTSNSIAYMDGECNITTINKFPYSNNFDLYENSQQEMWVLGSNGIYVTSVEGLLANGEIETVYYGRDNGLPCIATPNSYSDISDDGTLYIAGSTGVAKVNIDVPFENVSELKMSVPYVEVDGKTIYADESGAITIPSDAQKVTIYSFVYTYSLMNPQVTYYLKEFDQVSTTVKRTELSPVDYTNLDGGTYHFVMQLKDSMGHGNSESSVTIVKEKALHETIGFKIAFAAVGILLIGGVVALILWRNKRVYQRKEEKNRLFIREMTEAFAKTIDLKDTYTNGHSARVAEYTAMLTRELGYDEETVEKYYNIALMHDIGKIGVPAEVLNKPGKLTEEEYEIIKSHAAQGYRALKDISIMPELAIGAGSHHERPDGKGYPEGLVGDEIPRVAQIIAVADTFDAMYSTRPYRKRMNFERAVSIVKEVSGTQLTSDVVDAFLRLVERGEFRAPDDVGGGSTEDINNIRKSYDE